MPFCIQAQLQRKIDCVALHIDPFLAPFIFFMDLEQLACLLVARLRAAEDCLTDGNSVTFPDIVEYFTGSAEQVDRVEVINALKEMYNELWR